LVFQKTQKKKQSSSPIEWIPLITLYKRKQLDNSFNNDRNDRYAN
jgi:hypothetical protein